MLMEMKGGPNWRPDHMERSLSEDSNEGAIFTSSGFKVLLISHCLQNVFVGKCNALIKLSVSP